MNIMSLSFHCLVISYVLAMTFASVSSAFATDQQTSPPPADYAGKYPFDHVKGVSFRNNGKVVAAVVSALSDASATNEVKQLALAPANATDTPILQLSADRLYARSYDPASGGSKNWAILITNDGSKAAVCFSNEAVYGDGISHWYFMGKEAFRLKGACPSEQDEIEKSLGAWPIGPRPK